MGSDNGLAPARRQAMIWNRDGYVYIYASLGLSKFSVISKGFKFCLDTIVLATLEHNKDRYNNTEWKQK